MYNLFFDWLNSHIISKLSYLNSFFDILSLFNLFYNSGSHLLSRTVSSKVPSAAYVLTIEFGMRTGVSHKRIATRKFVSLCEPIGSCFTTSTRFPKHCNHWLLNSKTTFTSSLSLERRWSSRTFRYGYLVTTSPQLSAPPSAAPSLRLGHWLRAYPTPMVWRAVCTRAGNVFTATFWFAITSDSSFM